MHVYWHLYDQGLLLLLGGFFSGGGLATLWAAKRFNREGSPSFITIHDRIIAFLVRGTGILLLLLGLYFFASNFLTP